MPDTPWLGYAHDALAILAANLRLYRGGERACYRAAAAQLRLLLADTNRIHDRLVDISLLPRVLPDLRLHPLVASAPPAFSRAAPSILLADWLAQPLAIPAGGMLSIRDFIRLICEQDGGVHVDGRPEAGLRDWPGRAEAIVAIGEYVVEETGGLLENALDKV